MELIDIIPEFNLYEEFWKIYTSSEIIPPQYISAEAKIGRSIIGDGAEIYGEVENSVIGPGVVIGKGTVVRDSIIMKETTIGEGCTIDRSVIAENVTVGDHVETNVGEDIPNKLKPKVYSSLSYHHWRRKCDPGQCEDRKEYSHLRRDNTGRLSGWSTGKR